MPVTRARVRFQEDRGRLHAVEVRRSSRRPLITALHRTLLAAGVVVTSYQAQATSRGLRERLELSSTDGHALTDTQSDNVRTAILPLMFEEEHEDDEQAVNDEQA